MRGLQLWLFALALTASSLHAQPPLLPDTGLGALDARLRALEATVWSDPWSTLAALDAAAPELRTAGGDAVAAWHLLRAQALLYFYRDEDFAAAIDAGRSALASVSPARLRLSLRVLQGIRLARETRYDEAAEMLRSTRRAARDSGMLGLAIWAGAELAYVDALVGQFDRAQQELQRAHAAALELGDRFLVATVQEVFGVVYSYLDDVESAIRHYRLALQDYEALGYPVYAAEAVYGIGVTHRYAAQWQPALAAFERYRDLTEGRGNGTAHNRFSAAYGLGTTLADSGDCAAALPHIEAALEAEGPEDYRAELLKRVAVCRAEAGEGEAARAALEEARQIIAGLPQLTGTRWEIDLLLAEARMLAALGEYARAYELMARYSDAYAALLQRNASERSVAQRDALENARQALEIDLLQEQARVRALEIERQQRDIRGQRIGVALLCMALVLAGFVLWWRLRDMRRLRELSRQDPLTGLANRRTIFERLEELLAGLSTGRGDLALLLIDLDDFKSINDRYGHPVGDVVLQSMANAVRGALRPGDEVARLGGEEFMVVLPRTDAAAAMGVAWRLHECLQDLPVREDGGRSITVTASIGVACTRGRGATVDALYTAADEALYRAKAGGKNRCELASPRSDGAVVADTER